jgi:enterochelin esterase-like enzyme
MHGIHSHKVKVASGSLVHYVRFKSNFVEPRNVDVWLPDGYSSNEGYAVIYMHDGQMLFDATNTWNNMEWCVDETLAKLHNNKEIRECIIVAIWNISAKRYADYFPEKIIKEIPEPVRSTILSKQINGKPDGDNYLKFIVQELKPFIDRTYSTLPDESNTFIVGSSMGGLISLYAICEYPHVFGGAACLSMHSPVASFKLINDQTDSAVASKFRDYLSIHLPDANTRKIYFDYGDQGEDALYKPYQNAIDEIMRKKGYTAKYWQTQFFPGENHSEKSWAKRLHISLLFLLETPDRKK